MEKRAAQAARFFLLTTPQASACGTSISQLQNDSYSDGIPPAEAGGVGARRRDVSSYEIEVPPAKAWWCRR